MDSRNGSGPQAAGVQAVRMSGNEAEKGPDGVRDLPARAYRFFMRSRYSDLYLALILLAIASIPRFFYLSHEIYPNGVDEGVQIMSGRMMQAGYDFYSQINEMHVPLMIAIYGAVQGDPVIFRLFSVICSLLIMGIVMWAAHRMGGRHMMVAAGAFIALDIMFLHESRLASLDMFSLFLVCVGILLLVKFRQSGKRKALAFSGVAFALASMVKLFGTIATAGAGIILVIDVLSTWGPLQKYDITRFLPPRRFKKVSVLHLLLFSLSCLLVVLVVMARFGPLEVLQGTVLNQLHRPVMPLFIKLSSFGTFLLLTIGAVPFVLFGLGPMYKRPEGTILIISLLYALFFMFQATTWIHHLIFLSPAISIAAAMGIIRLGTKLQGKKFKYFPTISRRTVIYIQVLLVSMSAIMGGVFSLVVKERGESATYKAAIVIEEMTEEGEFVISGDPLIPVIADRPQPPNVVNVASLQYPEITDDELNDTAIRYGVEAIILTYHLDEMDGFKAFVESNYRLKARITDNNLPLFDKTQEYRIYYLPTDSELRHLELWATETLPDE